MNKRIIIIVVAICLAGIIISGIIFYLQSFKTVRFDVKKSDLAVKVEPLEGTTTIGNFTGSSELKLQAGKYKALVQNNRYDTTPVLFEVTDTDMTVTINPDYSSFYLAELLQPEQAAINKKITDTYASIINGFTLRNAQLYKEGQWCATILVQKTPGRGVESDIYRTVLKKEDGQWVIKAKPALVLSAKDYPDIPFDILSAINRRGDYQ